LNKHPKREQIVEKIYQQRKIWHTEWRVLCEDEDDDDDIGVEQVEVQTSQLSEEIFCDEEANSKKSVEDEVVSQNLRKLGKV
jgi:hypothetical protein